LIFEIVASYAAGQPMFVGLALWATRSLVLAERVKEQADREQRYTEARFMEHILFTRRRFCNQETRMQELTQTLVRTEQERNQFMVLAQEAQTRLNNMPSTHVLEQRIVELENDVEQTEAQRAKWQEDCESAEAQRAEWEKLAEDEQILTNRLETRVTHLEGHIAALETERNSLLSENLTLVEANTETHKRLRESKMEIDQLKIEQTIKEDELYHLRTVRDGNNAVVSRLCADLNQCEDELNKTNIDLMNAHNSNDLLKNQMAYLQNTVAEMDAQMQGMCSYDKVDEMLQTLNSVHDEERETELGQARKRDQLFTLILNNWEEKFDSLDDTLSAIGDKVSPPEETDWEAIYEKLSPMEKIDE